MDPLYEMKSPTWLIYEQLFNYVQLVKMPYICAAVNRRQALVINSPQNIVRLGIISQG